MDETENVGRFGRQWEPILNITFSNYSSKFLKLFVFFNLECKIAIFNYLLLPLDLPSLDPLFSFYRSNHSGFHRFLSECGH